MGNLSQLIRNRAFVSQIRDFSGMQFGEITPTDIDGFIEYRNKGFIFIESKHGLSKLIGGQRLALERLVDSLNIVKPALLIVCSHTEGIDEDIAIHKSIVAEYRIDKVWHIPLFTLTLYEITNKFLTWIDKIVTHQININFYSWLIAP